MAPGRGSLDSDTLACNLQVTKTRWTAWDGRVLTAQIAYMFACLAPRRGSSQTEVLCEGHFQSWSILGTRTRKLMVFMGGVPWRPSKPPRPRPPRARQALMNMAGQTSSAWASAAEKGLQAFVRPDCFFFFFSGDRFFSSFFSSCFLSPNWGVLFNTPCSNWGPSIFRVLEPPNVAIVSRGNHQSRAAFGGKSRQSLSTP